MREMNLFKYIVVNIFETVLRVIPFPCKTGVITIRKPNRTSPVFLTCNYHLTVKRVERALNKIDCYLLVANSGGHNVWCGATGGHFTNHDVISVLKTSGIDKLVDHKNVILPQLSATGIEGKYIEKKTGWKVIWGPVYAKDIRGFVENGFTKTIEMREVRFSLVQRMEMAVMWAFPFSIIASLIMIGLWPEALLPLNGLIWGLPFLVFAFFPFYSKWLDSKKKGVGFSKYTIVFDFGRIPLILWGLSLACLFGFSIMTHSFTWGFIFRWGFMSFVVILIVSLDLTGSTPIYKSGLHEERFLKVVLDEQKCKGAGLCEQICPRNCYEVDRNRHIATIPRTEGCVQCGACVVQCPFDALYFVGPKGEVLSPATVRRFKLNLIGKRLRQTGPKTELSL
jgi:NAD-dependent dihydropyrimidine dehydrogenase PreA subunit